MTVRPKEGDTETTSFSNLSGGERSFSTIAFLHSIWQCMDSPFYFLDEFDVFMVILCCFKLFFLAFHLTWNKKLLVSHFVLFCCFFHAFSYLFLKDKVNRSISMDVLITHAKERSESQFVFLTPQDISTIQANDIVTIHRYIFIAYAPFLLTCLYRN